MSRAGAVAPAPVSAARILALGLLVPAIAGALCVFGFAPFYAWPVLTPNFGQSLVNMQGNSRLLSAAMAFKNEPF